MRGSILHLASMMVAMMTQVHTVSCFSHHALQQQLHRPFPTLLSTTSLNMSLKPMAIPLMDAGKALARGGELIVEYTSNIEIYGGSLSAAGANIRNAGDCLAQAAASARFKTGYELVIDEIREAADCLKEAEEKLGLAVEEAAVDEKNNVDVNDGEKVSKEFGELIQSSIPVMAKSQRALEAAGAGIMMKIPLKDIGQNLLDVGEGFEELSNILDKLASNNDNNVDKSLELGAKRINFAATKMLEAGSQLRGETKKNTSGKKGWLKGGL